ncbi:MAG: protein kinase domain-containing protein, partial [Planctomycetota bacterium]
MCLEHKDEESIFYAVLDIKSPTERAAYLEKVCGGNKDLMARIKALLDVHTAEYSFLEAAAPHLRITPEEEPLSEGPGTVIGRYKLLERIGEGGMAVVYMAEQEKPIRRKVALKIIKLGMDTKSVIARFEAERQALAMMDHPNIAKVLDAGATETGRPYFVMELVTGVSITEYCDKNNLSTKDRLELFIRVCNAVQHAHQKGIIHRDIKPTNVMVTRHDGTPIPKIIDFGIAKATKQRLTEKTLFTRYAHIIGTPAYMSPEQADLGDLDVDTRSDIYSLGVLLYEVLTGTTPFSEEELRKAGYLEMQRVIREQEPPKPSTMLTTLGETLTDIAKHRGSTPDLLTKAIRGDLDWIVMKTLEKTRDRRYETASELAMDIERHLGDELVLAGPPSAGYRLRKFVRRNRVGVMTGLLVTAALLMVAVVSAMYALESEKAKHDIAGLLARSYVDRAQALCEQREVGRGMLWLADSLSVEPAGSGDLDRAIRTSLAAWHDQLHSLRAVVQYPNEIDSVTFSPDGSRILAACLDGTVRVCDAATGQPIGSPLRHGSDLWTMAISPDGKRIATGDTNGSVRLCDAITLKPIGEPIQHEKYPRIAFSSDSSRLMTGSTDSDIRFWDADTGRPLGKAFQSESEGKRHMVAMTCCPDGFRVVLRIGQWIHQMFDADQGEPIGPPVDPGRHVYAVAISPDGTRFATGDGVGKIRVWEAATGEPALKPIVHGGSISALAFSPDGSQIVSGGWTCMALLWDAVTGQPIGGPMRQRDIVSAVAFSPNGTRVVTGNQSGVVRIWGLVKGKNVGEPLKHEGRLLFAAYGPDGLRILTETDGAVQVRDAATGTPIGKPFSHPGAIFKIRFSPDGLRLLTKSVTDAKLRLWDLASGEQLGVPFHRLTTSITFSPDGSRILAGSRGSVARLWDAATLKCLGEFRRHRRHVSSVAFRPDGLQFLTGSFDGTTQLWDAATLEPIGRLLVHQSEVKSATFSPDGKEILIGFGDGTVRLWD